MEKTDILELTVKHLRQLQKQRFTGNYIIAKSSIQIKEGKTFSAAECVKSIFI